MVVKATVETTLPGESQIIYVVCDQGQGPDLGCFAKKKYKWPGLVYPMQERTGISNSPVHFMFLCY